MNIIAFSLWGHLPKYCVGAIKNADLATLYYPNWICRYYYGTNTDQHCIEELKKRKNVELIKMDEEGNWSGMFWRFSAADSFDTVVSRDVDSRISQREVDAVNEWLQSDKDFHIMRDHPYHATPILGGMWGARNGILKSLNKKINAYDRGNFWQVDQNFLREHVYPSVAEHSFIHDSFFNVESNVAKFPTKRINGEFVGEVFDENDERHPEHYKVILKHETN